MKKLVGVVTAAVLACGVSAPVFAQNEGPQMHWLTVGGGYALDTNSISADMGGNRRHSIYMGFDQNHKAHVIRAVARCSAKPRDIHAVSWDLFDEDTNELKSYNSDIIYKEKIGWTQNILNLVCRW